MQNVFPPLLSVQKTQQSHQASQMASQLEQESPPNLDLQMLMSQLEVGINSKFVMIDVSVSFEQFTLL